MAPKWSMRLQVSGGDHDGTVATEVDGEDVATDCSYRHVQGTPHCASGRHSETSVCPVQPPPQCPHLQVQYVLEDQKEGATLLDSWKEVFSSVWEMRCAIPGAPAIPGTTPRTHRKIMLETQRRSNEDCHSDSQYPGFQQCSGKG